MNDDAGESALNDTRNGPRRTLAELLALVAMFAAHAALFAEIARLQGNLAWVFGGMIVATNLTLCGLFGVVVRFRLIPLMAMFTTAALTEALLWQSAASGGEQGWIVLVAVLGALLMPAGWFNVRIARERSRARR